MIRMLVVFCLTLLVGCKNSPSTQSQVPADTGTDTAATESAGEAATSAGWAERNWNQAVTNGTQTVEDTTKWMTELFQAAKDEGITHANSMKEWVTEDLKSQGDWQYKIATFEFDDGADLEAQLNQLGVDRWECFHVETSGDRWTFLMKRPKRSYLRNLPLRDLARILPIVTGDDQQQ